MAATRAAVLEVQGAKQLRKTLKAAGDDLLEMKAAHRAAALIAARASADLAPERSGLLKKTIRGAGTKTAGIIRAGNNSKVPYAPPIHWGWRRRHIGANPFLSNGARNSEGTWIRVYENYVSTALDQVKGI